MDDRCHPRKDPESDPRRCLGVGGEGEKYNKKAAADHGKPLLSRQEASGSIVCKRRQRVQSFLWQRTFAEKVESSQRWLSTTAPRLPLSLSSKIS